MKAIRDWYLEGYSIGLANPYVDVSEESESQHIEAVSNVALEHFESDNQLDDSKEHNEAVTRLPRGVSDAIKGIRPH